MPESISANQSAEYRGFTIEKVKNAQGFHVKTTSGSLPRQVQGRFTNEHYARAAIDIVVDNPDRKAQVDGRKVRKQRVAKFIEESKKAGENHGESIPD